MKTKSSHQSRRLGAYTIAEVAIAVAILAFVGITLFTCFTVGFQIIRTTREDLRATQIMTQKIEAVRLLKWSQLMTNANFPTTFKEYYDPINGAQAGTTIYTGNISRSTNTLLFPSGYSSNVCLVTVSLTWTNHRGNIAVPHSRTMQTVAAVDGMQNYIWGTYK